MNPLETLITNIFNVTWQQSWELVGWTMCYFLAAGTVVALLGALLRFTCRRANPQIRYIVSLGVFATLAALPLGIAFWLWQTMPTETLPPVINTLDSSIARPSWPPTGENTLPNNPSMPTLRSQPLNNQERIVEIANDFVASRQDGGAMVGAIRCLPWVWLIGTPLTFVLLATGLIGSERLRKKSTQLSDGPIHEACQRLSSSLAISRRVGIAIHERIASPLLVGIVRPLILLPPAALTGWSPDELEMVLLHELAHVRRWDNLVNFLQRLVESLLFFHPAVWWVSSWVRRDREECCDAVVVSHTAKPQAYAELLVALATPQPVLSPPLAGLAMAQHPLAGRIRRILKLEEEKMLVSRKAITLAGTALAGLLAALLWAPTNSTIAEETNQAIVEKAGKTTEHPEDTEKPSTIEAIFSAPDTFADPKQAKIWRETQIALIKSKFVLQKAVETMAENADAGSKLPTVAWLQDNLKVRFIRGGIILGLESNKPYSHGLHSYYLQTVGKSYVAECKRQRVMAVKGDQASPFLTLEDQRAADLAYKMLGLELEPLIEEELQRMKKLGYEGGLRVSNNASFLGMDRDTLLVGLHIWPITTMQDLAKILQRDDIAELSPLKFYSIRAVSKNGLGPLTDKLITGRIQVNAVGRKLKTTTNPDVLAPGDRVKIRATGLYPDQPLTDVYEVESTGTLPLGPTYGRVQVGGKTLLEAEAAVIKQLEKSLTDPEVQIILFEKATLKDISPLKSSVQNRNDRYSGEMELLQSEWRQIMAVRRSLEKKFQSLAEQENPLSDQVEKLRKQIEQIAQQEKSLRKQMFSIREAEGENNTEPTTLLYDNKTFDQWRALWKNELKTERRTEAIKAMAAFGRAGYGKEAAKAILDVAGEYDFSTWDNNSKSIKSLKNAIYNVLQNPDGVSRDQWVPILLDRLEKDPKRWSGLATGVLSHVGSQDPEIQNRLLSICSDPEYSVGLRSSAIRGLVSCDLELKLPSTVELLRGALTGDDSNLIQGAMNSLYFKHLDKLPEQFNLLFHPDEEVKAIARRVYAGCDEVRGKLVLEKLLTVLNDPQRADDHRDVIRAIGTKAQIISNSGTFSSRKRKIPHMEHVVKQLHEILIDGEKGLLADTIVVLGKLDAESGSLVIKKVNDRVTPKRRGELAEAAEEADGRGGGRRGVGTGAF